MAFGWCIDYLLQQFQLVQEISTIPILVRIISGNPFDRCALYRLDLGPRLRRRIVYGLCVVLFSELPRLLPISAKIDLCSILAGIGMFEIFFSKLVVQFREEIGNDRPLEDVFCVIFVFFVEKGVAPFVVIARVRDRPSIRL